tara:strand:- start:787 stop:1137 length:351 start_codon:yes stop_codon:yes gene_type:complete
MSTVQLFNPGRVPNASIKATNIAKNRIFKKIVSNSVKKKVPEWAKKTRARLRRFITELNSPTANLRHVKQNYTQYMVTANVLNKKDMDTYGKFIHNSTTTNLCKHITKMNENIRKK